MTREHDIVVYGASGFTGRLVAEYFASRGDEPAVKWAMAGRNGEKLEHVRGEIGASSDVPILVADGDDEASLRALAESTKVLITTVGPYQLYGDKLVAACVAAGTDYVDLCGEPAWMRGQIDAHQANARASGARIVFSCGFDSIPFDLGVFFLQEHALADTGKAMPRVRCRVRKMQGGFSGGTAASLKETLKAAAADPNVVALLRSPFALTPGFKGPKQPSGMAPLHDETIDAWAAPFVMAPINTKNIHRSNMLMDHAYGEDFVYDEMVVTGSGEEGKKAAEYLANADVIGGKNAPRPGKARTRPNAMPAITTSCLSAPTMTATGSISASPETAIPATDQHQR